MACAIMDASYQRWTRPTDRQAARVYTTKFYRQTTDGGHPANAGHGGPLFSIQTVPSADVLTRITAASVRPLC
eukprot:9496974-Pyramimonas_sp.AAC.1